MLGAISWAMSSISILSTGMGWGIIVFAVGVALFVGLFGKAIPRWVCPIVIIALAAAFLLSTYSHKAIIAKKDQEYAAEKLELVKRQAEAEQMVRAVYQTALGVHDDLLQKLHASDEELAKQAAAHQHVVARERSTNQRLLDKLKEAERLYGTSSGGSSTDDTATASNLQAARKVISLQTDMLAELSGMAGAYAGEADEHYQALTGCSARYALAREASIEYTNAVQSLVKTLR